MTDYINHPPHYEGNIECIDAMYDELGIHVETGAMEAEGLIRAQEKRERKRQKRLKEA